MATLESDFEDKLKDAILEDVEDKAPELGVELRDMARAKWIVYAAENGYNIEHIWQDVEGPFVDADQDSVTIRIEWPGLTALFEYGVQPHTIHGKPLLHFYWEEVDQWVMTDVVNWGSRTGGIPASRAIRDSLDEFTPL